MGNGTAAVLEPTYNGYVASTHDALILFEACLTGVLHHVPRRPHDRERSQLVRSGSVFIYEENASGIKRWTDGVTWSPSRILGNFLVYRELDKPFPPGEKKRAVKKGSRRPTQSARAGEPYPRLQDSNGNGVGGGYSPTQPSPAAVGPGGFPERGQQSELERALVGSLVDSYGFKDSGLVKKTMSVTVSGVTHHLVSYYSVDDVMRGVLSPPSMVESLRYIRPRQELTTKQSFRAPIEDPDQPGLDDGDPSQSLYGYRPNPAEAGLVPQYGLPPQNTGYYTMPPQPSYATHSSQQQAQQQQPPPPSVPGYGVAPPQQNPYLQSPAAATSDVPTKTEEYASYRGPSAYPTAFQPSSSHPAPPSHSHLYRTPSIPTRPSASDIPTSIDPAASPSASAYSRASFTLPGAMDSKQQQPQQQQLDQRNTYPGPAPARRESAYYDQAQAQAQAAHQRRASIQQQAPPQQPQSQQPYYPNTAATGQSSYQGAPPMSTWGATHGQAI